MLSEIAKPGAMCVSDLKQVEPHLFALLHLCAVLVGLLAYVVSSHGAKQYRPASSALAWVIALISFPYLALPAFVLFGRRKERTPREYQWPSYASRSSKR